MKQYKVAILGATGAVGREMMKILAERHFPISELHLLASKRSAGKVVEWEGRPVMIEEACDEAFNGIDIVLGKRHCKAVCPRHRQGRRGLCGQFLRVPSG